jgi:hypothetical protein
MENSSISRNTIYQTLQNNQMPKDIEAMKLESGLHVICPIGYASYDFHLGSTSVHLFMCLLVN